MELGEQPNTEKPSRKDSELLHFNFLLRALRDLRGKMFVSLSVAA
jgi:hypothetical protein